MQVNQDTEKKIDLEFLTRKKNKIQPLKQKYTFDRNLF